MTFEDSPALERFGSPGRMSLSGLFFLNPHLLGDSSNVWIGGGRSSGGELERVSFMLTITVSASELPMLCPPLFNLNTDSCDMFCTESTGCAISRIEGRDFAGETMVADCLLSWYVSLLRIVGREGLENMARFSLFLSRSLDDAGDVTRGRTAVP